MAYSSVKGNASLKTKFQDLVIKCKKRSGFSSEQPELNNVTEKVWILEIWIKAQMTVHL